MFLERCDLRHRHHGRRLTFTGACSACLWLQGGESDVDEALRCCLVLVDVDIPLVALTDGVHSRSFAGNGLVVYHGARIGLVLVDRNTVRAPVTCALNMAPHVPSSHSLWVRTAPAWS